MKGISVIICTYNGRKLLPPTLSAISQQQFAGKWELIIVDNNSSDHTGTWAKDWLKKYGGNIPDKTIVVENKPGLSNARWKGVMNAKYDTVIFCDDDNHLFPDYLHLAYQILDLHPDIGALGGKGIPLFECEKPDWFDDYAHSYALGSQRSVTGYTTGGLYGAGCFFKREALLQWYKEHHVTVLSDRKGVDLSSGGDTELCFAMQLLGYRLYYSDKLQFHHFIASNRLNWTYYLRLKGAIASSYPLLEGYKHILKKSNDVFFCSIFKRYFIDVRVLITTSIQMVFRINDRRLQLGRVVALRRLMGVHKNYRQAQDIYRELKSKYG